MTNTRGHSAKLTKHKCRLDLRRYFFSERVVDMCMSHVIGVTILKVTFPSNRCIKMLLGTFLFEAVPSCFDAVLITSRVRFENRSSFANTMAKHLITIAC